MGWAIVFQLLLHDAAFQAICAMRILIYEDDNHLPFETFPSSFFNPHRFCVCICFTSTNKLGPSKTHENGLTRVFMDYPKVF
mgnify:CR=1 FL=1